jgi:hypothetical protein
MNTTPGKSTKKVAALALAVGVLLGLGWLAPAEAQQPADHEALANHLALILRSARKVVSDNQALINDKDKGDKGLSADKVVEGTKRNYKEATGRDLTAGDPATPSGKLTKAALDSIKEVMDKAQPLINKQGTGFKGFLPAVFARQVSTEFTRRSDGTAVMKLTAPKSYVRNRANMPDAWEEQVIEGKFKATGWSKGKAFSEMGEHKGQRALRLMIPEYYGASCLSCHGDPKGERDVTGGQKEGGKDGELGGAISVAIYAK